MKARTVACFSILVRLRHVLYITGFLVCQTEEVLYKKKEARFSSAIKLLSVVFIKYKNIPGATELNKPKFETVYLKLSLQGKCSAHILH